MTSYHFDELMATFIKQKDLLTVKPAAKIDRKNLLAFTLDFINVTHMSVPGDQIIEMPVTNNFIGIAVHEFFDTPFFKALLIGCVVPAGFAHPVTDPVHTGAGKILCDGA